MSRSHIEIGKTITLRVKFYSNGVLFDPYQITSVQVLTAKTGGTVVATLAAPTKISTGLYETSWTVPTTTSIGKYYDSWTWVAEPDMSANVRIYSFNVVSSNVDVVKPIQGPMFVGSKEVDFFNSITKELIQKIVAEEIIYYSVSEKHTKSHPLYDEAIKKTVYTPVRINALVMFHDPEQSANKFSIDTVYKIDVYFHIHELQERNVIPREGDFLKYGLTVYEIEKLVQTQLIYGQVQNKVMVHATCRVSRKSQFEVLDNFSANSGD